MVSIIIAAYNEEKNIAHCIHKICNTDLDFEIIIVNDGSKDNTWEVLKELSRHDKRIHIYRQENKGCSAARNLGLENAHGEWITFVDADDEILPSCIEIANATYIETDIIQGNQLNGGFSPSVDEDAYLIYSSECIQCITLDRFKYLTTVKETERAIVDATHGAYGKLFRTEFINNQRIRFIEGLGLGEDMLFYLEALQHTDKVVIFNKPIYRIVDNKNSSTRSFNPKMIGYTYAFIRQIVDFYNRYDKDTEFFNNMCYQIYNTINVGITANILRSGFGMNMEGVFEQLYSIPKIKEYLRIAFRERMQYKEGLMRRVSQSIPIFLLSKGQIRVYFSYLRVLQRLIKFKKMIK